MIPPEILESLTGLFPGSETGKFIIHSSEPLSGGCINHVHRLDTSSGNFCIKYNRKASFPGMFESESAGLSALRDASEIRVPGVILTGYSQGYSFILLEFIRSSGRIAGFMNDFGHSLARLHRHSSDFFGFGSDNYIGALPQSNRNHPDWTGFFIEERLEKQVNLAVQKGYLDRRDTDRFSNLYGRLKELLPPEPPSLLHGDLWGGNYMVSDYGHREVDLAMTTLFGGFESDFYSAYHEEFPLEKDWKDRLPVYNLYPLLIHLNLFGTGYLGSVREIIARF
jgi:fructosamine-3-kinase